MTDIVERLRTEAPSYVLIGEAAIEIERLREALETIKEHAKKRGYHMWDTHADYYRMSSAALEGK